MRYYVGDAQQAPGFTRPGVYAKLREGCFNPLLSAAGSRRRSVHWMNEDGRVSQQPHQLAAR